MYERHNAILRSAIENHNGFVFRVVGDAFSAAFHTVDDALNTALQSQRDLHNEVWSSVPVKVRMGINTGPAQVKQDTNELTYEGYTTLALTQRVMSAGHGGQILLSRSAHGLVKDSLGNGAELRDMGEHKLKDIIDLERLYQVVTRDLPSEFPPLMAHKAINHNLPPQLTSFIGREHELKEAHERLASTRLLTLSGPGGTGKTRLSLQISAEQLPNFKDGAWLVELAPLSDPAFIVPAIASVFEIREVQNVSLIQLVMDYLRAKELLLVLDNCEHLVEASAQIVDQLLRECLDLKIIASSREPLGVDGETIYRVPSLKDGEATRLFAERATKAEPRFRLADENASFIAQICSCLDGIPLAIELAAARVKLFTPEQIASRLDDRFKLLTGGSRTALPRQQTLRALIDWSYDMLLADEQVLLRRLSTFAGGWSFEAAEAIGSELDVLDLLSLLVNKSLVVVEEGNEARYRLLETIRQYTRDKLLESGEGEDVRNKHMNFFLRLAETAEPNLESFGYLSWAAKLNTEHDNIRTALEWGLAKDIEAALRFVGALGFFWTTQGYSAEGNRWAKEVLEKARSIPSQENDLTEEQINARARAFLTLSRLATDLGDNETVRSVGSESVALARKSGDQLTLSLALAYLASGKGNLGEGEDAYRLAEEALALASKQEPNTALGFSLVMMGQLRAIARQDYKGALAYGEEAIAVSEAGGNKWGSAMTTFGLGFFAKTIGDYEQARSRFRTCFPIFLELGDTHRINMIQSELAHIEREQGHYEQAIPMYRETILEWQRLGHRAAVANQLECFAFIAKAEEQPERAAKLLGTAEALRKKINIQMTDIERVEYDRQVADLKSNTDDREFSIHWSEGRSMTMEQAIELALE